MTADVVMVLADNPNPGRTVGLVLGRLIILGLIIWGIVHLIRKRRRPGPPVQYPQPYWDGTAWQYPQAGGPPPPQPYWDGAAWQYPQQQQPYPPPQQQQYPHQPPQQQQYPHQPPQQQYPQQPPYPGARH